MGGEVDLHIHSNRSSDGDFSPFHIIRLAKEREFRAISISDHDTVAAYPEAVELAEREGVEVIPSVELTTLYDSREFHLLLPFVDWRTKAIRDVIAKVAEARLIEAQERVKKLQEVGFDLSWKEVAKKSKSSPPLGVTIAQILLDKAERAKDPRFEKYFGEKNRPFAPYIFYKDYFMEGKPGFVPKRNVSMLEVLEIAIQTRGIPVLAHPGAYFQQTTEQDLIILRGKGLEGLEVYSSYHNRDETEFYKELAEELDLVPTAGSDFHGKIKPHIPFGSLKNGEYWMVEELRRRRSE